MTWIAIAALTLLNAYNWLMLIRLQRRIEQLTWLAPQRDEKRKTRWAPDSGWAAADKPPAKPRH
jgi:hypothetical protein